MKIYIWIYVFGLFSSFWSGDAFFMRKNCNLLLESENDELFYQKPVEQIGFDSLFFRTSMCFGSCSSMELKILSTGEIYFKGIAYTRIGSFRGELSSAVMDKINEKLSNLHFNKYKQNYTSYSTCQQSRSIILFHNGRRDLLYVYGHTDEPAEINMVFDFLERVYLSAELYELDHELQFDESKEDRLSW